MNRTIIIIICLLTILAWHRGMGTVIHVPGDHTTIQSAIDASSNGDTVLVETGTYFENINFHGKKIRLASRYLLTLDPIFIEQTIINGSQPTNPDTASVVLFISGEDTSSVLEGFTITGGTGTAWKDEHSAGVFREGGGILTAFTSPTIKNNLIIRNHATNKQGLTSGGGGGIRSGDGNPRILNNIIMENDGYYGGGVVLNYTAFALQNNVIYKNSDKGDFGGGGVWINNSGPGQKIFINNTIVDNTSSLDGGGVYVAGVAINIRNSIIWGNIAPTGPQISQTGGTKGYYCDVEGGFVSGVNNINVDPQFIDTSHYLSSTSPCIDAGDPGAGYNDPEDSITPGFARFPSRGTLRNDIGAYGGTLSRSSVYIDLHLNDPKPPTTFKAYSDYQTPSSIILTWVDPTSLQNGAHLSNFKIHIYRDTTFIAEVDSGSQTYTANSLLLHQFYTFSVRTTIPTDSSTFVVASAYAGGHEQPQSPTSFSVTDAAAGVLLTWKNPSRQLDNTPLNDLGAVLIYRDSTRIDSLVQTSGDTSQIRSTLDTVQGYHWYYIKVVDTETPPHYSISTSSVLGHGGLLSNFSTDFESNIGDVYRTGMWDTTSSLANSQNHSMTDSPVGNYLNSTTTYLLTPPVVLGSRPFLQFSHIAIIAYADVGFVEISRNTRKTFTVLKPFNLTMRPEWQDGHADSTDWITQFIDLSAYTGDTVTVRFRLNTNGSNNADGWYVDDITIGNITPSKTFFKTMDSSWNFISVPVIPPSQDIHSLYPTGSSKAFTYSGMRYESTDSAANGVGFWLKFPAPTSISITGPTILLDTIPLHQGWNTVGSLSSSLSTTAVRTVPSNILASQFYRYNGTYTSATALEPGKAYWIKARQAGSLILSSFLGSIQPTVALKQNTIPSDYSTIEFRDNDGHRQILYVTDNIEARTRQDAFELPPIPPTVAFDVRFRSNKSLEVADDPASSEFTFSTQGIHYPLHVQWTKAEHSAASWIFITNKTHHLLHADDQMIIDSPQTISIKAIQITATTIPKNFLLEQNFPNPFNPSTEVHYQLPVSMMVKLAVYNVYGQEVVTLVDEMQSAGYKSVQWNANGLASGVYVYKLLAGDFVDIKKMVLLK